jgi:hypothetical protein
VDFARRREYGTLNKITGELHLSNEAPKLPFAQGSNAATMINARCPAIIALT